MSERRENLLNRLESRTGNLERSYDGQGPLGRAAVEVMHELATGLHSGSLVIVTDELKEQLKEMLEVVEGDTEMTDWSDNAEDLEERGRTIDGIRTAFGLSS